MEIRIDIQRAASNKYALLFATNEVHRINRTTKCGLKWWKEIARRT